MASYLVERYLPSMGVSEIEAAVGRLALEEGSGASDARHLWTTFIAVEETCLSMFEAASADAVVLANRQADFPFDRVVEASLFLGAILDS